MKLLQKFSTFLALCATAPKALGSPVAVVPEVGVTGRGTLANSHELQPRLNCDPGQILVYSFPNSTGSYAYLCISKWTFFGCIIFSTSGTFSALAGRVADWVTAKVTDASDAGPQVKREDAALATWGELYNYTSQNPQPLEKSILTLGEEDDAVTASVTAMGIHEDGFSASFELTAPNSTALLAKKQDTCTVNEQVHIHYWAAAGHEGTLLDWNGIQALAYEALWNSYDSNYDFSCYELLNSGSWNGWFRVCYNYDTSQIGCGSCGGHNN